MNYITMREIMNRMKISFMTFLLVFFAVSVTASTPKMFFAEYRFVHPEIKEGLFQATSRKLWRIGFRYVRLEEAPDPVEKIHGLIIINAPDTYLINRYTNSGKHIVDRAENTNVHVAVFQSADLPEEVQALEMGHENDFFAKHNVPSTGVKIIEGIKCDVHRVTIRGFRLTLYKRRDIGTPLQVGIQKGKIGYDVRYLKYQQNLSPDFSLFEVPRGARLIDVNSGTFQGILRNDAPLAQCEPVSLLKPNFYSIDTGLLIEYLVRHIITRR